MLARLSSALILAVVLQGTAVADIVYLSNGSSFDGVISELDEAEVRIRMPFGEMTLPRSMVERVEKSDSALEEYLRRKGELRGSREADASQWLELALWADSRDLLYGAREAGLIAADLDPRLEGLGSLMRRLGYILDEDLGRWVPLAEYMRRQGFVLADGEWITVEERDALQRAAREEQQLELERRRANEFSAAVELAQLALVRQALAPPPASPYVVYSAPAPLGVIHGGFFGGFVSHPGRHEHRVIQEPLPRSVHPVSAHRGGFSRVPALVLRQPGSLLPPELIKPGSTLDSAHDR